MFAQRLKELRKLNGLSQAALSSLLGVTQQAVGKWETGRSAVAAADGPREFPIPIIGTVRAGFGAFAFEEDYGEEYARVKDPGSYFYLLVKGDSMEPRISDGDLALVHRQPTLENGDLGVVIFGEGEGTLKKFIRRGNTIILQPFNNVYAPQIIMGEDLEHLYIAGKVVETRARW